MDYRTENDKPNYLGLMRRNSSLCTPILADVHEANGVSKKMLTAEIRSQVDAIWNAFWTGGISKLC